MVSNQLYSWVNRLFQIQQITWTQTWNAAPFQVECELNLGDYNPTLTDVLLASGGSNNSVNINLQVPAYNPLAQDVFNMTLPSGTITSASGAELPTLYDVIDIEDSQGGQLLAISMQVKNGAVGGGNTAASGGKWSIAKTADATSGGLFTTVLEITIDAQTPIQYFPVKTQIALAAGSRMT
jgi:hypothetical protein